MYERFWSQFKRLVQTRLRLVMTGTLIDASHVRPSIVPALRHWFEKPDDTEAGTSRSSSVVMSRAYVMLTPYLWKSSASMPHSVSSVFSGRRFLLPSVLA